MSHHIYNTKAFIIDTFPNGESDLLVVMYTEDFGLISAIAKGLRDMKSKLRYSLQQLSYGSVALVRGREFWRITNASTEISLFNKALSQILRTELAKILSFVRRFSPGEDRNNDIYEALRQISAFFFRHVKDLTIEDVEIIDLITKMRIMYSLGYIKNITTNKDIFIDSFSLENAKKWLPEKESILKMVEGAVQISHL